MRLRQCAHILLLSVTLVGGQVVAGQQRQERIFGSSSGSSVIVVYKKDHDKDNVSTDRLDGPGGGVGLGGIGPGGLGEGRDFRARDQRDPRDRDHGRKVDVELRKDHGIKIFSNDDERDVRHDLSRHDPLPREDHHGLTHHKSRVRDGISSTSSHPQQQHPHHQLHRKDDRRPGILDDRRDFDDAAGVDDDYRFTKAKDSYPPLRGSSSPGFSANARPACARELDLCAHNHDYPIEKVQTIVDRYYNQMYDLYHAMYKIPPHEVQWVENFTHSFSQEKQHGEFVCRSETSYLRIGWAKNYKGHWMAVVNTERFPQTTRVEKCRYRDKPCEYMAPCFKTSCKQREMLFPLIAVNPHDPSQKPQVDLFPIPSGCVCYVDDPFFHSSSRGRKNDPDHGGHPKLPAFLR